MEINIMMTSEMSSLSVWLRNTSIRFSVRGAKLRAIDSAIQRHEMASRVHMQKTKCWGVAPEPQNSFKTNEDIAMALTAWKKAQGSGEEWKVHPRNKTGEITKLNVNMGRERILPEKGYEAALIHARLGIIYLFSRLNVNGSIARMLILPAISIASDIFSPVSPNGNNMFANVANNSTGIVSTDVMHGIRFVGEPLIEAGSAIEGGIIHANATNVQSTKLFRQMVDWLTNFARKLAQNLKELFYRQEMRDGPHVIQISMLLTTVKAAITMGAITLCQSIAGFATDGTRLIRHLTRIADVAVDGIRSWWRSRSVSILNGHPTIICDTLKAHMAGEFKKGIYNVLKASAGIAIQVVLPGLGSVIRALSNIIISVLETIYNMMKHSIVVKNIRGIINQCQYLWKAYKKNEELSRSKKEALFHEDSKRFATWYREIARTAPELIALTLNSGICGDKMHFLHVFDYEQGTAIRQNKFDQGVKYLDSLKDYSANLLRTSDYRFTSDHADVAGYITIAKKFDSNQENKVWKFVKKAAEV